MLIEKLSAEGPPEGFSERIIHDEHGWFDLPQPSRTTGPASGLAVSRWTGFANEPRESNTQIAPDSYVVGIALRPMDVTVFAAHKLFHEGRVQQGMMCVNEPGCAMRGIFRGGYDMLHVHIPTAMIDECASARGNKSNILKAERPVMDTAVERLATALLRADDFAGALGRQYADGVGIALVARLLARNSGAGPQAAASRVSGLPKWRLKRATDYIAAHLGEPISLVDIATSTGLTRMHFAAQFRVSTGLRPHEYVLRRRIERAQELLATSRMPLFDVALAVGFSTQAHFTTVFTRFVGETPNIWRRHNDTCAIAA